MSDASSVAPESTAVRVALWRALHARIDAAPHVLVDQIGLELIAPDPSWPDRPDMDPQFTRLLRASIVARARFIEDLVLSEVQHGVAQYVILGAGLDTFAQRRPDVASGMTVFEVDQPGPQIWKQQRLAQLGYDAPESLRFVPVDFEAGGAWWEALQSNGFDSNQPAVITSTGVSMYLTQDAIEAMLRKIATLAPRSTFAMTFMPPLEMIDSAERPGLEIAMKGAAAAGTPFLSLYTPSQIIRLAYAAGFRDVEHVSTTDLSERYFTGRADGLTLGTSEQFIVART